MHEPSSNDTVDVTKTNDDETSGRPSRLKKFGHLLADRWPEYILEIVVVIIGITISFAIDSMKEKASNRTLEQTYLRSLHEDITSDISELERVINETQGIIIHCQTLMSNSSATNATFDKLEFIKLVRSVLERPIYIAKNATFSALKSSGNFQLVRDNELKNLLFEYDQEYQGMKLMEAAELQVTATITGPYFIKTFPLDTVSLRVKRLIVEKTITEIEFVNNIELRLSNRKELLNNYSKISGIAKEIDALLRKSIEDAP